MVDTISLHGRTTICQWQIVALPWRAISVEFWRINNLMPLFVEFT